MYKYNSIYSPINLFKLIKKMFSKHKYLDLTLHIQNHFKEIYNFCDFSSFSSGREALYASLKKLPSQKNEVITPVFSCSIIPHVIRTAGRTPVFADIDPYSFGIDFNDVKKRITPKTGGIIVIHEFGNPVSVESIKSLNKYFDGIIIEDAAIAIGTKYQDGSTVGKIGDYTIFSGGLGKPVSACSWGGLGSKDLKIGIIPEKNSFIASYISFSKILTLLMFRHYLVYKLANNFIKREIQKNATAFGGKVLLPSRLDMSLMLSNLQNIEHLHQNKLKIGNTIIDIINGNGLQTLDIKGSRPMFSRIPIVFPDKNKISYAIDLFKKHSIEVKMPYHDHMPRVDRNDYKNFCMIAEKIISITAAVNDPNFFESIDNVLKKISYRQSVSHRQEP